MKRGVYQFRPGQQGNLFRVSILFIGFFQMAFLPARAYSPHLASITPTGAQRGTEIEAHFNGERLGDTEEVLCYEPGIEALKLTLVSNKLVQAQLKIANDCPLGEHHLRLRAASGVSELRTFVVGPFPALEEKEPNNEAAKAQPVPVNSTVTGVITSEDVDCFKVEARKGQRFSVEAEGMRLGRGVFDPRLAVLDERGSIVSSSDDTWLAMQDPFVSFVVPRDGACIVQLREASYGGDDRCHYRLHIGSFPRPTSIYPPGGQTGETLEFKFFSEATGEFTQRIKLPEASQDKYGIFAQLDALTAPTPNWIRVSTFPNVLESGGNHERQHASATDLEPPMAFNGIISEKGEEDWFRFRAAKGVALEMNVYARRLRSPLDSVLEVFDANGKSLAANDDGSGADSSLKFTPAESTNYFARIRDTMGQGGRDFTYRIEIVPAKPRLSLKIPEVSRNDTQARQHIAVPRGNRFATLISAKRENFSSDLTFGIEGLPAGVTMKADIMAANLDAMPLVFEAVPDAPVAGKLLDLTASGTNADGKVVGKFAQNVELVEGPNNTFYYGTSVDKLCVAVTKEAPFHMHIVEPKVPLVQAGSMRLEVVAEREPGFEEPIEVRMVWNPPGISSQSEATISKAGTNVFYQLNANGGAETRLRKIAVLGHATVDGGQIYVSSQLSDLEIASPFLTGKIETLWVNPGKTGKLTVNLQQAKPFEGTAAIRLLGLPEKVSAAEKEITKDDQEVIFEVVVDEKCPTGSHKNLFCAVDVKQNGQVIPHTIASGGILRIVPEKKETVLSAGTKK